MGEADNLSIFDIARILEKNNAIHIEDALTAGQIEKVKNITIKSHGTTATLNVLTGKLTFTDNGSLLMREATDVR